MGMVSTPPGPGGVLTMPIVAGVVPVKRGALATVHTIAVMIVIAIAIGVAIRVAIGKRWVAIIMTVAVHHAIVTILSSVTIHSTGGVAIGVGGGGVVGAHGAGVPVLYPRHPGGVIVVDSLGVVLLCPSL